MSHMRLSQKSRMRFFSQIFYYFIEIIVIFFISGKFLHILKTLLSISCMLTVLAIAYDRYLGICFPMNTYTKWRAMSMKRILGAIWFSACAVGVPELFSFKEDKVKVIGASTTALYICYTPRYQNIQRFYHSICSFLFVLAFIVSVFWLTKMTSALKTSRNGQAEIKGNRRKTIALLITVVVVFLICLLPYRTLVLLVSISPDTFISIVGDSCFSKIFEMMHILSLLHSALNPLMYSFVSTKFSKAFRTLLSVNKTPGNYRRSDSENTLCRLRIDTDESFVERVDLRILAPNKI